MCQCATATTFWVQSMQESHKAVYPLLPSFHIISFPHVTHSLSDDDNNNVILCREKKVDREKGEEKEEEKELENNSKSRAT